jgi:hypothetical protein
MPPKWRLENHLAKQATQVSPPGFNVLCATDERRLVEDDELVVGGH